MMKSINYKNSKIELNNKIFILLRQEWFFKISLKLHLEYTYNISISYIYYTYIKAL